MQLSFPNLLTLWFEYDAKKSQISLIHPFPITCKIKDCSEGSYNSKKTIFEMCRGPEQ